MAKKPSTKEKTDNPFLESISEKYEFLPIVGSYLESHTGAYIPTTLGLDIALNGGIREGTITSISAKPKGGKTTLCLTIAANAQKMGKNVYYIDVENRLQNELLDCIDGLDKNKLFIIRSTEDKFLTAENYMNIIESLIKDDKGCVVILDSIAALCTENEFGSDVSGSIRSSVPKLMYSFFRKISQIITPNKSCFIGITHIQANTSGYGSPNVEVGGNAIGYFASNWIMATKIDNLIDDKTKKSYGKNTTFKVLACASGAPDGQPTIYIRYGKGLDKYEDIISLSEEFGILEKAGAWYNFPNIKELEGQKFQGRDSVIEVLSKNPNIYDIIEKEIRTIAFGAKNE